MAFHKRLRSDHLTPGQRWVPLLVDHNWYHNLSLSGLGWFCHSSWSGHDNRLQHRQFWHTVSDKSSYYIESSTFFLPRPDNKREERDFIYDLPVSGIWQEREQIHQLDRTDPVWPAPSSAQRLQAPVLHAQLCQFLFLERTERGCATFDYYWFASEWHGFLTPSLYI